MPPAELSFLARTVPKFRSKRRFMINFGATTQVNSETRLRLRFYPGERGKQKGF